MNNSESLKFEEQMNAKRLDSNKQMFKEMLESGLYHDVLKEYLFTFIDVALDKYTFGVSMLNTEEYIKMDDLKRVLS